MTENQPELRTASKPPIPLPEALPAAPVPASSGWEGAPGVVRLAYSWAFYSMWIGLLIGGLGLKIDKPMPERLGFALLCVVLFFVFAWQRRALKRDARHGWWIQIPVSAAWLLWFPLGTVAHGYILSQWFTPNVKAWFDQD